MIEILLEEGAKAPVLGSAGAAAMDLHAFIDEVMYLYPGQDAKIRTGVSMAIPEGQAGFMWPRSGLDINERVTRQAGLIDADYRGEIIACLHNRGNERVVINPGDRIVQIVFQKIERHVLQVVDTLSETVRGESGFGASGKQ